MSFSENDKEKERDYVLIGDWLKKGKVPPSLEYENLSLIELILNKIKIFFFII